MRISRRGRKAFVVGLEAVLAALLQARQTENPLLVEGAGMWHVGFARRRMAAMDDLLRHEIMVLFNGCARLRHEGHGNICLWGSGPSQTSDAMVKMWALAAMIPPECSSAKSTYIVPILATYDHRKSH